MKSKFIKKIKRYGLISSLWLYPAFFGNHINASDIFIGLKSPTNWQLDQRINFTKNDQDIETITDNLILKYWDGENVGKWVFLNLPYKFVNSPLGSNNGLGDISLGFGPRGKIKNFHIFGYFSSTFPTADSKGIILGNRRYDKNIGILSTYLSNNRKFEVDFSLEERFTGKNKKGINPPNETSSGLLIGGAVGKKMRFATGFTYLINNDGNYIAFSRSVLRHTYSQKLHLEFISDIGLANKKVPKSYGGSIFLRYNF